MKNNDVIQLILSLRNEFAILHYKEDDDQNNTTSGFFQKIQDSGESLDGDEKVLYDILKETFIVDYYNANSWKMRMTDMDSQDVSQIETWTQLDFKNYISESFRKNNDKESELKKISLEKYIKLFRNQDQDIAYYNTLWEWYLMKKISFLSDTDFFMKHELKENQTEINTIYEQLIAENDGNAKLYFMHQKLLYNSSSTNCKDKPEELQALLESDHDGDYKVLIMRDLMTIYTNDDKQNEALAIADQAKNKFPDSSFLQEIRYKADQLTNPSLGIHFEEQTQSSIPIHIVAEYRNISDFELNIYEVYGGFNSFLEHTQDYYAKDTFYDKIEKKLIKKEYYRLPDSENYEEQKTSLEIQPLPSGIYIAEFFLKEENDNHTRKNFFFTVSDHKVIYYQKDSEDFPTAFKLVNSENGKPVPDEDIILFKLTRNEDPGKLYTKTDENGIFTIPDPDNDFYRKYLIHQPKTNDFQIIDIYGQRSTEDLRNGHIPNKTTTQIFTDRSIYRPGQTVYFKVINTQIEAEKESVVSGVKQKITLLDVNDQEVSSQEFTTNEFGSYNGNFVLPKEKLNGMFSLKTEGTVPSYHNFRVEEYKRPNFEIRFDPVKEEYQYGQTLELKGRAVMFSGIVLSNVTVHYEIKKQNIRWKYLSRYSKGQPSEESVLGEATTDAQGEFIIPVTFEKNIHLHGIQIDRFEIEASVTDINGETQSASTGLNVASVSYYIKAEKIKDTFNDENLKIQVETKTYNDQNISKSYHAKLSKLVPPDRIVRTNFDKEIQNLSLFSREEFTLKFPHDFYDKDDQSENRKTEKVLIDQIQQPTGSPEIPMTLDLGKLEAGKYKLELYDTQDKEAITTSQYFNVWDKNLLKEKIFLNVIDPQREFSRGEKADMYVYSAIPEAQVNIFVQDGLGNTISEIKELQAGILKYTVEIPQNKAVSTINIQFQMIAYNSVQTQTVELKIKEDEKLLTIETTTFRDHIEPGSKEKWSVKITGKEQEKINAEVLANMYDRSLDQFSGNTFRWEKLYLRDYSIVSYSLRQRLAARFASKNLPYVNRFSIDFPYFNWYDGDLPDDISLMAGSAHAVLNELEAPRMHKKIAAGGYDEKERGISTANMDHLIEKIPVRRNLNETAFFFPDLKTDSEGNVSFEFTSPEALTTWKLMFLAHTKDARAATLEKEVITRKEFSVTPNYPRFLREGDELNFQSKLSNLTSKNLSGSAALQILDALTNEDLSSQFGLHSAVQNFDLNENGNSALTWTIKVPENVSSIIIKVVAKAGQYSDGEQKAVGVLPGRILVTDALPIFVKEGETKTFELENLKNTVSTTISNVSNTLELTTNPIWEIMFALPGLKNDRNNSSDAIFNKWFADVLASEIFKANPKMKTIFEEYQSQGIMNSDLEKNQELKQLLLDETPWALESKNENEQMEKLALLFDVNSMKDSISKDWEDFSTLQNPDGGFSWYQGYPSSYSVSLHILKNLGRINVWLKDCIVDGKNSEQKETVKKLIGYIDREIGKYYDDKPESTWTNWSLEYLDARRYWEKEYPLAEKGVALKSLIQEKIKTAKLTDFTFFGLHRMALLMNEYGLKDISDQFMHYLKETSVNSKNRGIYWKQNLNDWGWFSSKIINHAGALEAFNVLKSDDQKFIEDLKIWLVTQKEANAWGSSRGTAEVIFTMLNSGKSWTGTESDKSTIIWSGKELTPQATGYIKSIVKSDVTNKDLATVTITKQGPGIVQGGLFWQYYECPEKIKSSENYISVTKELYKKVKTVTGAELQKITHETPLKVGDKVTVRMILNTDRAMEFIHIRDMRAAGLEPVDVLSGYRWKNNLGYYQSTKDASANFYIQYMPKGKYVFEYDMIANASGKFSNGITTIQNYYAPQMNAHTESDRTEIC